VRTVQAQNSSFCTGNQLCVGCIFLRLQQELRGYASQLRLGM
jgi:hypothetical protein